MASQRRRSVASTPYIQADDTIYPVDHIKVQTMCELHTKMKNLSMKVAAGTSLEITPGVTFHGRLIPTGYARVGVDEIVKGYEELELDIAAAEGEMTLGEVFRGIILWRKELIVFP